MSQNEADRPRPTWEVFGRTVRGASHLRSGAPNQDALRWEASNGRAGPTVILAVADGHGSRKSFRSERGSRFAVRVAAELLREFEDRLLSARSVSDIERTAEIDLPKTIVRRWQQAVDEDHQADPPTPTEWDRLDPAERKAAESDRFLIYGSTILAALLTPDYLLCLQLGDGDILCVGDDGRTSRPMPPDDRLIANETVSLCSPGAVGGKHRPSAGPAGAWSEFRVRLQPLDRGLPALILLSTDGYANAFRTDEDFAKVGADLLGIMRRNGPDFVRNELEGWLSEASATASGDDVTLGLIYRLDAIGPVSDGTATDDAEADSVAVSESEKEESATLPVPEAAANDETKEKAKKPGLLGRWFGRREKPSKEQDRPAPNWAETPAVN